MLIKCLWLTAIPHRSDLTPAEYDQMKEETIDQINEFTATLDRMHKGDSTLDSKFTQMRQSIRQAIAAAFNATETRRMFGDQNAVELESQLVALEQALKLKRLTPDEYDGQKMVLLTQLQDGGRRLAAEDRLFVDTRYQRLLEQMEQVEDDGQDGDE